MRSRSCTKSPPEHSSAIEMNTYLADSSKTDGGKYVRGLGFITDNYLDELYAVKVANQQTHTTQFRQITVSISSANNAAYSDEELMEIGVDMAKHIYSKGFQVVVYLLKDTKNPHLHFLANAVNFRTGNIFRQTKKELNRLKVHCNHILNDHCLDQIQMSPEDMLDTAPHDLSDGFEAFEIFDEIMMDKAVFFEDLYDEALFTQHDSAPSSDYNNNISFSLLNISGNVNFRVPSSCNKSQLADLINNVTPVSEQERVHNAKIGIGALAELKNRGYDMPVYVDNSININITFDDLLSSDIDIIDARFTEE